MRRLSHRHRDQCVRTSPKAQRQSRHSTPTGAHNLRLLSLYGSYYPPFPMTDDDLPAFIHTPPGLYRHYKGGLYEVIDTVRHSETLEPMTLYRALYGQRGLWVRPAAMFLENVWVDGKMQPRFERCSEGASPGNEFE